MNTLQSIDCTNKRVLVRVDLNVKETDTDSLAENLRLTNIRESVDYILNFLGSSVTLITHLGRPEGKVDLQYSTRFLQSVLQNILHQEVSFTDDCLGSDDFTKTRIALRENLRFYSEEKANDAEFAQKLSTDFDLYVNEAFSVSHRNHASVVAITEYVTSCAGISLQREIEQLTAALKDPARPAIALLGGAKIETKLPLIRVFEELYDTVLLGGIIANEARDQKISLQSNVLLPIDFRGDSRLDIGDKTVEQYTEIILGAKTILWNGPFGKFEEPPYDTGTIALVEAMKCSQAHIIAGGGESLSVIHENDANEYFDVLSSGGGAMLAYLAGEKLPGIVALG